MTLSHAARRVVRSARSRERGVVLLLILVILAVSISTAYVFSRRAFLEVLSARQQADYVRAELMARSGIDLAIRVLVDDIEGGEGDAGTGQEGQDGLASPPDAAASEQAQAGQSQAGSQSGGGSESEAQSEASLTASLESSRDVWKQLGNEPIAVPGGELRVVISDSGVRIPLRGLLDENGEPQEPALEFLTKALERIIAGMPGRREEKLYKRDQIAEGIIDWVDRNQETRLGDDEKGYYRDRGSRRGPVDRDLLSIAELSDVPGIDAALLAALSDYFGPPADSPRFQGAGINPNTAPPHILGLVYLVTGDREGFFLEDEDIFRVLKTRAEGRIFCPTEGAAESCTSFATTIGRDTATVFPPIEYRAKIFAVRAEAKMGSATACVRAVVNRAGKKDAKLLSYRLGC